MNKAFEMKSSFKQSVSFSAPEKQGGASLILVMIILTIVSMIGIAGVQISMMSERGARNDRDYQLAWQSAEAGLIDAENDLFGPGASSRRSVFGPATNKAAFVDGCGTSGNSKGLCALAFTGKPAWITADFDLSDSEAVAAVYGDFTGRTFAAGGSGIQPARKPRYVIEAIPDKAGTGSASRNLGLDDPKYVFRVTSMGFGPRADIQAVVQMIYRN
jgi:type IV pilus assembly protein PilX